MALYPPSFQRYIGYRAYYHFTEKNVRYLAFSRFVLQNHANFARFSSGSGGCDTIIYLKSESMILCEYFPWRNWGIS